MRSIKRKDKMWKISISLRSKLEKREEKLMKKNSINYSMVELIISRIIKRDRRRESLML